MLVDPLGPGLAPPEIRTQQYLEEVAVGIAKQLATGKLKVDRSKKSLPDKVFNFAIQYGWVKDQIFNKARGQVMKMSGGLYPAPLKVMYIFAYKYNNKLKMDIYVKEATVFVRHKIQIIEFYATNNYEKKI